MQLAPSLNDEKGITFGFGSNPKSDGYATANNDAGNHALMTKSDFRQEAQHVPLSKIESDFQLGLGLIKEFKAVVPLQNL